MNQLPQRLAPRVILKAHDYAIMHVSEGRFDYFCDVYDSLEDAERDVEIMNGPRDRFRVVEIDHSGSDAFGYQHDYRPADSDTGEDADKVEDADESESFRLSDYLNDLATVDLEGNIVDSDDDTEIYGKYGQTITQRDYNRLEADYDALLDEHDAAISALRFVYALLDEGEYDAHDIYMMMRGYCDRAKLLEFS